MSKIKIGTIVSDKMNQTAVVHVSRMVEHPLYHKRYRLSKRFKAHNPENQYKEGDKVVIEETRPLSKDKNWKIIRKVTGKEQE